MDTDTDLPVKRKPGRPHSSLIVPLELLVDMYVRQKMTIPQIAEAVNIRKQTISERLRRCGVQGLEAFKRNRRDIFAIQQMRCISNLTDQKLKKASARDLGIITGVFYDKEHNNPVTHSIDVEGVSRQIDDLKAKRDQLAKQLEGLGETIDITPQK